MKQLLLFLSILLFTSQSSAQNTNFSFYRISDNLISEQIKMLVKDQDNILWIATDNGIFRFNGIQADNYSSVFRSQFIKSLTLEKNGNIRVVHDLGIGKISQKNNNLQFSETDTTIVDFITSYRDTKNTLWIGGNNKIVRKNKTTKTFFLPKNTPNFNHSRVFHFSEDGFKNIWAWSFSGNIYTFKNDDFEIVKTQIKLNNISWVHKKSPTEVWIAEKKGIVSVEINSSQTIKSTKRILELENTSVVKKINNNEYLIGTWDNGTFLWNSKSNTLRKLIQSNIKDVLWIEKLNPGEYWIVGSEEIGILKTNPFKKITVPEKSEYITSVKIIDNESILASSKHVVYKLNYESENWVVNNKFNIGNNRVERISSINDNTIATTNSEIILIDWLSGKGKTLHAFKEVTNVYYAYEDIEGNVWILCSGDNNIIRIDNINNDITFFDNIKEPRIIKNSPDGRLLLGGDKLYEFDYNSNKFEQISIDINNASNFLIEDFLIEKDIIKLATNKGPFKIEIKDGEIQGKIKKVQLFDQPNFEIFRGVIKTNDNSTWWVTNTKLIRTKDGLSQYYDKSNALPSNTIKFRGIEQNNKGDLWIATEKGLVLLESKNISTPIKTDIPNLIVSPHNKTLSANSDIEFKYNIVSYPYSHVKYQTRIIGIDSTWKDFSSENKSSFMNFKGGEYTFQVKAWQKGKVVSDAISYSFVVNSPWYLNIWFYIFLGILFILIGVYFFNYKNNKILANNSKFNDELNTKLIEKEAENIKIIEEKKNLISKHESTIEQNETIYKSEKAHSEAQIKYIQLKEEQLEKELLIKNKQLATLGLNQINKNNLLATLKNELKKLEKSNSKGIANIQKIRNQIDITLKTDKEWEVFLEHFQHLYIGFYSKLKISFPELTQQDLRHCALIRLNLSNIESSNVLGISLESLKTSRYRLKKKLKLDSDQNLHEFIITI